MDPLVNIFPEIQDMVYQHFNAEDFLKVTEVSPSWSEIIEKSLVMMKNVKLHLKWLFDIEKLKIFRSTRRYQNVLVGFRKCVPGNEVFQRLSEYLAQLGPLTGLRLEYVFRLSVAEENLLLHKIDLSRMKILELRHVTEDLCFVNGMLSRCDSLLRLELSVMKKRGQILGNPEAGIPSSISSLIPFLERNQNLQELELRWLMIYKLFFANDISEIVRFKLKRLKIIYDVSEELELIPENIERNLLKFLATQSQSLESFHIHACRPNVIEHAFNKMPKLTSLNVFWNFSTEGLHLNLNENILEVGIYLIRESVDFEKILRCTPKVTTLFVRGLTAAKIEIISRHLPDLRRLQFETCERVNDKPVWASLWPHAIGKPFYCDLMISYCFYSIEK